MALVLVAVVAAMAVVEQASAAVPVVETAETAVMERMKLSSQEEPSQLQVPAAQVSAEAGVVTDLTVVKAVTAAKVAM